MYGATYYIEILNLASPLNIGTNTVIKSSYLSISIVTDSNTLGITFSITHANVCCFRQANNQQSMLHVFKGLKLTRIL